jgi:hypothetical protein
VVTHHDTPSSQNWLGLVACNNSFLYLCDAMDPRISISPVGSGNRRHSKKPWRVLRRVSKLRCAGVLIIYRLTSRNGKNRTLRPSKGSGSSIAGTRGASRRKPRPVSFAKRRFHEDPELGYAFLEKAMIDKEPS